MRYSRREYRNLRQTRNSKVMREQPAYCYTHRHQYMSLGDPHAGGTACPLCVEDERLYAAAARELTEKPEAEGRDRRSITREEILRVAEQRAGRELARCRAHG